MFLTPYGWVLTGESTQATEKRGDRSIFIKSTFSFSCFPFPRLVGTGIDVGAQEKTKQPLNSQGMGHVCRRGGWVTSRASYSLQCAHNEACSLTPSLRFSRSSSSHSQWSYFFYSFPIKVHPEKNTDEKQDMSNYLKRWFTKSAETPQIRSIIPVFKHWLRTY